MHERQRLRWQRELRIILPLALIAFFIFANSLNGAFIYDDTRQIVRNGLIQDATLYGTALTSDVWAFKGDGTVSMSNYWRPSFTAFQILNFQIFGLNPFGWHLLNILLHVLVCCVLYLLLRRWGLPVFLSLSIALIFAVHPIHTESVAWISGSPDLLFAICLLASLWFAGNHSERGKRFDLILAIVFYALALGSKEVAFLCFPLFWLVFAQNRSGGEEIQRSVRPVVLTIPFAGIGILYFLLRWAVLGRIAQPAEGAATLTNALLTLPAAFVFYLKQIVYPVSLGPNYPLRSFAAFDLFGFFLPLAFTAAVCVIFYLLARRSFVQKAGLLLFFMPLLPTLNITAFIPEQIVHDRYLYLPLAGFLMLTLPFLADQIGKIYKAKARIIIPVLAVAASLPLALKTYSYNRVWTDELALWKQSITVDGKSSFNWAQFGTVLTERGRYREALDAYNNALDINPAPLVYLGRARANLYLGNPEEAVWDLKTVTEMPSADIESYTLYRIYEALAIAFAEQKKSDDSARVLIEARRRLPIYSAALTEKLAVVYYNQGKKQQALTELEDAEIKARAELLPESKTVLLRLAMLNAEIGRKAEARRVLEDYLRLTAPLRDEMTLADRRQAIDLLRQLQ